MISSLRVRLEAELVGTATLVGIGTGVVVAGGRLDGIDRWLLAVSWFVAVTLPVAGFQRVSGAHLNPAITLALVLSRKFPRMDAGPYIVAQLAGAFAGSFAVLVTLGNYARLGATVPVGGTLLGAWLAEFGFTLLLVGAALLLSFAGPGRGGWRLVLPGAVVGLSTYLIGPWTGSSLNPARTLAPAVLPGTYTDLWVYLTAIPLARTIAGVLWRSWGPPA